MKSQDVFQIEQWLSMNFRDLIKAPVFHPPHILGN